MATITQTEIHHEHALYAEPIFYIKEFPITNSLLNSWLVIFIIVIFGLFFKSRIKTIPRGLQNGIEIIVESLLSLFDSITGSKEKTLKIFPIVFSFFVFILLNNWLGLLPGVGSITHVVLEHGEKVFVPLFRGGTADLNTTLALAGIGVVISHIFGIIFIGFWQHLNKFINFKALIEIPKKVFKEPSILIINPIKFFLGLLEIISEAAKLASLSFRLFGNIFAGEVLLASMSTILAFGLPIPFMFLEIVVGLVQAMVFSMLILTYLTIMTSVEEH
ncbi:MAG: FoF1 ATP synthase subunit a [Patescibacteria group bacterium]|nr:F0F1 ATP synthase subunit A [Patescibacteria group bacterium]MBU1871072.1 F0F1 ATP synthase subunit A [Patescibacteria group bacterium]